jgi:dipeptidyl-peptidase-4
LCRVRFNGEGREQLTNEPGVHSATFSKNHAIYVLRSSGPKSMPRSTVFKADGTLIDELPSVAEEPPFVPGTEIVKVSDGDGFYCSITRPRNFDKGKRYPVLVDVYAGPQHQQVMASMGSHLLPQWLADQGFIVVAIDGRGTPGRGRDWEQAIRGSFAKVPLDDQIAGLKALGRKFPEMDLDRVGITGWSFGGYMSALAVLKRPDVFKAAVAGAPVTDWEMYDSHYTEHYLGLPNENKEGYKESSLITYADKLQRPLLLIHGTTDDNVFFAHTMKLADALFRAGKEFELLPLNGFTHLVPDPSVREKLEERIVRFFHRHLGEPK